MGEGTGDAPGGKPTLFDIAAIAFCTLAWGTTWFAITLQFGVVDPVISIVYRFALSAAVIFAWCALRRGTLALTLPQHLAALGIGFFTFSVNYPLVYWAEERVSSAVVAVLFAALAFVNLIAFRIVERQHAPPLAWVAAALGVAGVALLSWGELTAADLDPRAVVGLTLTGVAVIGAAIGNLAARRGEKLSAPLIASTGWAMGYGAALLTVFALASGRTWAFDPRPAYIGSLLYLAIVGSVIAFLLYYALARRRGYATASYISALAPPVAMLVSSVFEAKTWGLFALAGVALVLAGQWLLLQVKRKA
jgi:drug/metabolite transporter (DMT)-like permease